MPSLVTPLTGDTVTAEMWAQLTELLMGLRNIPISLTGINDPVAYAQTIKNAGTGSKAQIIYAADGTTILLQVDAAGVKASSDGVAAPTAVVTAAGAANLTGKTYAATLAGAVAGGRFIGGNLNGPPASGTFIAGDFGVDQGAGALWVCTAGGSPGTWKGTYYAAGLTGATSQMRFVGANPSGAPTAGTWQQGDVAGDYVGRLFVCTVAGTPGTWVQSGSFTRIAETLLGSANAAIDFSSIPATYRHLKLIIQGRCSAGIDVNVLLQFNGDTAGNYDHQQVQAASTTVSASENIASTTAIIGQFSSLANVGNQIELTIANYALTTLHKSGRSSSAHKDVASSGNVYVQEHSIFWRSTAAINAIHLALASGNFEVGTIATLYGMST